MKDVEKLNYFRFSNWVCLSKLNSHLVKIEYPQKLLQGKGDSHLE